MNPEEVDAIKKWQMLFGQVHDVVQQELIKLALVLFRDAQGCKIEVELPEVVRVYLKPYGGFKGFLNRYIKRYNRQHQNNAKKLVASVAFWMPLDRKTGMKPKIEVLWDV